MKKVSPKHRQLIEQEAVNAANAKAHDAEIASLQDSLKERLEKDLAKAIPPSDRLEALGQRSFAAPAGGWPVFK
jgi:hypothetical protein